MIVEEWHKAYKKSPKATAGLTVAFLAVGVTISIFVESHSERTRLATLRQDNTDFKSQLDQLDATENSLTGLLAFVQTQRHRLQESQTRITELESEKKQLEPLVKADRALVEAFFLTQEKRQAARVWWDRLIGFALGVLASLIASVMWYIIFVHVTRRRREGQEPKRAGEADAEPSRAADRDDGTADT